MFHHSHLTLNYTYSFPFIRVTNETRTVRHMWYKGWPDYNVPEETVHTMLEFMYRVRQISLTGQCILL